MLYRWGIKIFFPPCGVGRTLWCTKFLISFQFHDDFFVVECQIWNAQCVICYTYNVFFVIIFIVLNFRSSWYWATVAEMFLSDIFFFFIKNLKYWFQFPSNTKCFFLILISVSYDKNFWILFYFQLNTYFYHYF